jgi:putative spermidine/putrescine transport system substrate-binding protein
MKRTVQLIAPVAIGALLVVAGCGAPTSPDQASAPTSVAPPSQPIVLNIMDAGGVLAFTKPTIESFKATHPNLVSAINFEQAPSTDAVSKIRAQQAANQPAIDLVLGGADVMGAGLNQGVWTTLTPSFDKELGNTTNYTTAAQNAAALAKGDAVVVATELTGPILEYNPAKVSDPPTTADALLAWAKAHPKRFTYAQPPASGPGRDFLMGLPYLLGDANPGDPANGWSKTWSYLHQLNANIAPPTSSTGESIQGLAQGSYDMIITTAGFDLSTRASKSLPLDFNVSTFQGAPWIAAGHYMLAPKGVSPEHLDVVLQLMNFLLQQDQQVGIYGAQLKQVPGPSVKGVTLDQAPANVQQAIQKIARPEYAANISTEPELPATALATALDRWNREIGTGQ